MTANFAELNDMTRSAHVEFQFIFDIMIFWMMNHWVETNEKKKEVDTFKLDIIRRCLCV